MQQWGAEHTFSSIRYSGEFQIKVGTMQHLSDLKALQPSLLLFPDQEATLYYEKDVRHDQEATLLYEKEVRHDQETTLH
jgi:hypothetical protein